MQLTYRGVRYSINSPTHETAKTAHKSVYRGVHYRLRTGSEQSNQAEPQRLVYRGVPYMTGSVTLPF
ncbi:MAG: DUF4278 domain-containing protein [Phormidesmis sp.]